jgi:protein-S-isoprenylcysteine O-methyltransferase Ste14
MLEKLELKIPPLALTLVVAGIMWLLARLTPGLPVTIPLKSLWCVALAGAAAAIALAAVSSFRAAHTTVDPTRPNSSSHIVSTGVYRWSRNPMYLSFLLGLAAWAVYLSQLLPMTLLPLFVLYLNRFQIVPEERALCGKFGAEYVRYMASVRRWL